MVEKILITDPNLPSSGLDTTGSRELMPMQDRQREIASRLISTYVAGWLEHDPAQVLSTLDHDCLIIESYGPMYRGTIRVAQWLDAWFGEGNRVDRWEITSVLVGEGGFAAEWRFACTWRGQASEFEGVSLVRLKGDRIAYMREYATTAPIYEWEGT